MNVHPLFGPNAAGKPDDDRRTRCRQADQPGGGCDGSGWLLDEDTNETRPCVCRAEMIARRKGSKLSKTIPPKYEHASFDAPPVSGMDQFLLREMTGFVRGLDKALEEGQGLFLFGDRGTGKTTLAMAIARAVMERNRSVAIYNARELVSTLHLASTEMYDGENILGMLDRFSAVELLLIDDLAVTTDHDWIQQLIYSIINRRYEHKRSMLITADVASPEKIADHIGWRSASRLLEVCEPVPVFGQDHRVVLEPPHRSA